MTLDGLNDAFAPTEVTVDGNEYYPLEGALEEFRADLAAATEARDRLARQGATNAISQLALNALADFGDVGAALQRFQHDWRFWLPDDTAIIARHGEVDAINACADAAVPFRANGLSAASHLVGDLDPATIVGRPITEVINNPYLSRDMTVLKASWSENDGGRRWLDVDIAMPRKLFCSASGRVWDPDAGTKAPTGDNVVAFARRA